MFKNTAEMAIAIASGRRFKDPDGFIYLFTTEKRNQDGQFTSPFKIMSPEGTYADMSTNWANFATLEEIFSNLPDLEVDAIVSVRDSENDFWRVRHFKEWRLKDGKIICFTDGKTSSEANETDYTTWKFWGFNEGKYQGLTSTNRGYYV